MESNEFQLKSNAAIVEANQESTKMLKERYQEEQDDEPQLMIDILIS